MLKAVIRFSLQYSSLVLIAAVMIVGYAGYRLPRMSVDVFPELNAPTVTIMAESGGLAADEVEQYVTFPIETAVNGMTGVRRVRSASAIGLGIVWVDLEWGTDLFDARQLVAERLVTARENLPNEVEPFITPITSIAGEIMLISLSSPDELGQPDGDALIRRVRACENQDPRGDRSVPRSWRSVVSYPSIRSTSIRNGFGFTT